MLFKRLKDHLIPHADNGFRPTIIGGTALCVVLVAAVLVEGAYIIQKDLIAHRTDFLAAVLPGTLIALTNEDRNDNGVGELTEDALLTQAAQLKANDMATKGYFAHVTPDGKQPWDWLTAVGYKYSHAGENLAVDFTDSEDVEEAWMDSPTHRANIVKPVYTKIGIATARGEYKGRDVTFVVQFFATPAVTTAVAAAPKPAVETPVPAATPTSGSAQILGDESVEPAPVAPVAEVKAPEPVAPAVVPSVLASAAASPNQTASYALLSIAALLLVMLAIAIHAHVRLPYVEALGGTFAVLTLVGVMLLFNAGTRAEVEVPTDGLSASVVNAF